VAVFDTSQSALERARARAAKAAPDAAAGLRVSTQLEEAVRDADLVIEAVPELIELKREVFARLDAAAKPGAYLATNTSELSVTAIAAATARPELVVGMHWFNPPERMRLVEMVRGVRS